MFEKPFVGTAPDYSESEKWLSLPENLDKAVDLVFIYPSSCNDPEEISYVTLITYP